MTTKTENVVLTYPGTSLVMYNRVRSWNTQKHPFKAPLPYSSKTQSIKSTGVTPRVSSDQKSLFWDPYYSGQGTGNTPTYISEDYVRSRASSKLKDKLGNYSEWATNLLEARGSLDMMTSRLFQLASFAKALRKGDFRKAAKVLRVPSEKIPKNLKSKDFGSQWLEFHFGWAPLVDDIGSAVEALSVSDFGTHKLRTRSGQRWSDRKTVGSVGPPGTTWTYVVDSWTDRVSCQYGCEVRITNPNAFLANQMGFVNPLSVAWEAVPFSFVLDWFVNVGQFLASFTDFVGLDVTNAYTTIFHDARITEINSKSAFVSNLFGYQSWVTTFDSHVVWCRRDLGLIGYGTLAAKPFRGFSVTRGATAIALLIQQLKH